MVEVTLCQFLGLYLKKLASSCSGGVCSWNPATCCEKAHAEVPVERNQGSWLSTLAGLPPDSQYHFASQCSLMKAVDQNFEVNCTLINNYVNSGRGPRRALGGQPKTWAVVGFREPAGMSGSLGRAAGSGAGGGGSAEQLDALVKKDKVVVFLKGTTEQPQCGFSNAVVQILWLHGVRDYAAYEVLDEPELRQGIKDSSNWPTIPQVYLNGEFVRGCDILLQMHQNGDLVEEQKKLGIRSALLDEKKDQDPK
nr:LOW QUALITY PROTEIN: glutaredoxin-related protein 5, mitochondrial-like [Macaca fascicularis]